MIQKSLSDVRLLQAAEMLGICTATKERLKDFHFLISDALMSGDNKRIEKVLKSLQELMIFLKGLGPDDAEAFTYNETKRVLNFYEKKEVDVYNKLDILFKKEGSKLNNFIYNE